MAANNGRTPRIVALVPMRHDSERVPGKNWRDFSGLPLFHHIVRTLLGAPRIDEIVINTDSPVILRQCAARFPQVRLIERSRRLRGGHVPMNDILRHDVAQVDADFYLQTHSTNPLLTACTIERAIDVFLAARPDHDSLFSVTRMQARLYDGFGRALNHDPRRLERTQDLAPLYQENSNIYIFTRETLLACGGRIGRSPLLFEMDPLEAIDIDDDQDFLIAETLFTTRRAGGLVDRSPNPRAILCAEGAV